MLEISAATHENLDFLVRSLVNLCTFINENSNDLYSENLPVEYNDDLKEYVEKHIDFNEGFAFVASLNNELVGCIYGKYQESQLPVCLKEKVAFISVAWVETKYSKNGIGEKLLKHLEAHLREKGIKHIELSYLSSNHVASNFWSKMGFNSFRVFAHKKIT